MTWEFSRTPMGSPVWVSGEYRIETTGRNRATAKTGAVDGRRVNGGYRAYRGPQSLGSYATLTAAQARAERDAVSAAKTEAMRRPTYKSVAALQQAEQDLIHSNQEAT